MKNLLLLFSVILLTSCGTTRVAYDYDEEVDFSKYQTYNFMPDIDTNLSPLDLNRLKYAMDEIFVQKGFVKSDDPELLINIYAEQYQSDSQSSLGIGVGGTTGRRGGTGIGVSGGIPLGGGQRGMTITVDMIDSAENTLIWQAYSDSRIETSTSPKDRTTHFAKLAKKILEEFPPED